MRRVVATGNFDGWHLGHQGIYQTISSIAQERGLEPVVVTFTPHTAHVLSGNHTADLLTPPQEKKALFAQLGIKHKTLDFTAELAGLPAAEYISEVIVAQLQADAWVFGDNHRFGRGGMGDFDFVRENFPALDVRKASPTKYQDVLVSSSYIRELVQKGEVTAVKNLLGREYSLRGTVVRGLGRGRTLGFPTANLQLESLKLLPATGVYGGYAMVEGQSYPAVVNVGQRPTFADAGPSVEVHLIDQKLDLYDKIVEMKLNLFIRSEMKFANAETLRAQIARDVEYAQIKLI